MVWTGTARRVRKDLDCSVEKTVLRPYLDPVSPRVVEKVNYTRGPSAVD